MNRIQDNPYGEMIPYNPFISGGILWAGVAAYTIEPIFEDHSTYPIFLLFLFCVGVGGGALHARLDDRNENFGKRFSTFANLFCIPLITGLSIHILYLLYFKHFTIIHEENRIYLKPNTWK